MGIDDMFMRHRPAATWEAARGWELKMCILHGGKLDVGIDLFNGGRPVDTWDADLDWELSIVYITWQPTPVGIAPLSLGTGRRPRRPRRLPAGVTSKDLAMGLPDREPRSRRQAPRLLI